MHVQHEGAQPKRSMQGDIASYANGGDIQNKNGPLDRAFKNTGGQ